MERLEEAWRGLRADEALPVTEDGRVDLTAVSTAAGPTPPAPTGGSRASRRASHWRAAARACREWRSARTARAEAERRLAAAPREQAIRGRLDRLAKFADHVANTRSGLSVDLRTALLERRFRQPLQEVMTEALRAYSHRADLRAGASIAVEKGGLSLRVVDAESGATTGLASFSRSQLVSSTFGLLLATHLGHPRLPTGFICLDDVTDVLDMENLAVDALTLRKLAYGPLRRQVIMTSHHHEATDRLVPLLLPPKGRSMRIIEMRSDGDRPRSWRIREERAVYAAGPPGTPGWRSPLGQTLRNPVVKEVPTPP